MEEQMSFFYKVLVIDLSTRSHRYEDLDRSVLESYIGGYGLGAWYTFTKQNGSGIDPLGPENILSFCPGLLNRTGASFGGRFMVTAKSPLTGGWGDANCGGKFGPALKACGLDLLAIHGVADKPVMVIVGDDSVEIRDADELWGKDAVETEEVLKEQLGTKYEIASIGTGGEKLIKFAGIVTDKGRIAARSGVGAVMGSKRLKSIAVKGSKKPPIKESDLLKVLTKGYNKSLRADTTADKFNDMLIQRVARLSPFLRMLPVQLRNEAIQFKHILMRYGTTGITALSSETGDSPVKNWAGSGHHDFPLRSHALKIDGPEVISHQFKTYFCAACPLGCGGLTKCNNIETHKPEYETVCALGTNCLVNNLDMLFELNEKINRAGIDSITMGAVAAFAFEAWERGFITEGDTDGVALGWGDAKALAWVVEKTIAREGLGDVLANGLRDAGQSLGCESIAMHAGGEALPMHDTRFDPTFAIAYACEPTPGRHTIVSQTYVELMGLANKLDGIAGVGPLHRKAKKYDPKGKGVAMAVATRYVQVANSMGLCLFGLITGELPVLELLNAATGWAWTIDDLLRAGERIETLRHSYNIREGIKPKDFALPDRALGRPPLEKGPLKGVSVDFETMQKEFFDHLGWNVDTGQPATDRLKQLGLEYVAESLGVG